MHTQTMGISQFKAQTLKVLDHVAKTHENVIITKRGKPFAQITPYQNQNMISQPGSLASTLIFEKDILSPLGEEMWDACQ